MVEIVDGPVRNYEGFFKKYPDNPEAIAAMLKELRQPFAVLDHGYIRLTRLTAEIEQDGDLTPVNDLAAINDARASFARTSDKFERREFRLMNYLRRDRHTSPFRGSVFQFEWCAPLFVARQAWKYCVGADADESLSRRDPFVQWNEVSRRYVDGKPTFYLPGAEEWRAAPETNRQGSAGLLDADKGAYWTECLNNAQSLGAHMYEGAIKAGIAPEMARLLLPAYGLYVTWRFTLSLQAVCHMIDQRLAHAAQAEYTRYAEVLLSIMARLMPLSCDALLDGQWCDVFEKCELKPFTAEKPR